MLIAISNAIELEKLDGDCYGLLGLCHLMVGNFYCRDILQASTYDGPKQR